MGPKQGARSQQGTSRGGGSMEGQVVAHDFASTSAGNAIAGPSKPSLKRGANGSSSAPISISGEEDEEEDDFEEVAIPSAPGTENGAGPSSPYPYPTTPITPGDRLLAGTETPGTAGTNTTAPSIDDNYAGYGEDDEEEAGDKDDGVIRLEIGGETPEEKAKRIALALRKKPMTSKDRAIRLEAHKLHVVSLLASARIRNRWAGNTLLKARLLSLLPHPLQAALIISPSRFPDRAQRSRLFFDALQDLVTWWSESFFDISDKALGLRTRPWDEVQETVDQLPRLTKSDFVAASFLNQNQSTAKGKGKISEEERMQVLGQGAGGERLRTVNSLMKKALQQEGSRDVSAQLFVSLARACGLGTRLVTSLQTVPWRAEKAVAGGKKKQPGAGRGGQSLASRQGNGPPSSGEEDEDDEEEMEEVPIPLAEDLNGGPGQVIGKIKAKNNTRQAGRRRHLDPADVYRLKKPAKPPPQALNTPAKKKKSDKLDLTEQPPVFWAEIFSRSDQRWIPVDPVKGIIRKKTHYEPLSDTGPIRLTYVIAFEEDGYARDVTLRYAKNFGAKTSKLRPPPRKDEPDWWAEISGMLSRPYRLNRDELEDAELETSQYSEGMPQHMGGFKDHPIYALERHLKREEVIQPKREIGRFRGEPVYRRANVLSCKTAENWMRTGRRVKDKQEPLKWVKQRAVTIQKRRAQELALQESGEAIQQGLYAESQTEIYRPPPIVDVSTPRSPNPNKARAPSRLEVPGDNIDVQGKIPTNSFGNIDLYAPTMLPAGAVHLPFKGIAKVVKQLGISYAEACTGFEFKNQRAIPVITGVVVAEDQEATVLEAYWESAAAAEEKEKVKKEDKALKRWVKLINGLRVRARLQAEYGQGAELHEQQHNPLADPKDAPVPGGQTKTKATAASVIANTNSENTSAWVNQMRDQTPSSDDDPYTQDVQIKEENPGMETEVFAHAREAGRSKQMRGLRSGASSLEDIKPASPPQAESDEEMEEILPPAPSAHSIKLKVNGSKRASTAKRKVDEVIEDSGDKEDISSRATKKTPRQGAKKTPSRADNPATPTPTPTTRSLRSRAPKTEEKAREERAARARVRAALESDYEDNEE